jgi:hypothetical protein
MLERCQVAVRGPDLELGVAGRAQLQQQVVAAVAQLEARDHLGVAAVEALGQAQDGREPAYAAPEIRWQLGVLRLRLLGHAAAVIERHEGHHLDLLRIEAAQVAVLDQIVRVFVMARITDVHSEVVHKRGVLEPLAIAIGAAMDGARLVEQRE